VLIVKQPTHNWGRMPADFSTRYLSYYETCGEGVFASYFEPVAARA
jgi:hypothetical protein